MISRGGEALNVEFIPEVIDVFSQHPPVQIYLHAEVGGDIARGDGQPNRHVCVAWEVQVELSAVEVDTRSAQTASGDRKRRSRRPCRVGEAR